MGECRIPYITSEETAKDLEKDLKNWSKSIGI